MTIALDALNRAIDALPGGRPVVAVRLNKTIEVLRKELSPASSHKLGADDAIAIARMCVEAGSPHAYDYAQAVAAECGGRFEYGDAAPHAANPMERISDLMRETSDVTGTFIEAMADSRISDNELERIEREICEAEAVLSALRQASRRINAAGKPRTAMIDLPVIDRMRAEAPGPVMTA